LRGHSHVIECLSFIFSTQTTLLRSKKNTNKLGHDVSTLLVSGSRDKSVKVWNFVLQECLFTFSYHDNWVKSVILHPSGNYVISTGDDRSIRVMDLKVRIMVIKKWVEISQSALTSFMFFANQNYIILYFFIYFIPMT
jgi:platelet-activating factor acetylhydrolase IB subunit alpha